MIEKIVLGTDTIGYPQKRNFVDLPFEKYRFEKKQNLHKLPAVAYFRLKRKSHEYYWNTFFDLDTHSVPLFHFFNSVSIGKTPWVTTFETSVPRWSKAHRLSKGMKILASSPCRKLIALSACTLDIQHAFMQRVDPILAEEVAHKMMVLHPPQKVLTDHVSEVDPAQVRFCLVGAHFFRKGGLETLKAFEHLHDSGIKNWHLAIVSAMIGGDYASKSGAAELREAKRIIDKLSAHISHFNGLPNDQVLKLLQDSDVGLLPTYADTYGYSVLESQAAGCPVISTNIRALPEINCNDSGWMIEVPKDSLGNALLNSSNERAAFSAILVEHLIEVLKSILEHPDGIQPKAERALNRIKNEHSILSAARKLEDLYDSIVRH